MSAPRSGALVLSSTRHSAKAFAIHINIWYNSFMRTGAIYIIKNTANSKVYVGQTTITVHERFMTHLKPSTEKRNLNRKLYNAIRKYGKDKFFVETLETNIPLNELDEKEIYYIALFDSFNNGYNSTPGGDGRIINVISNEEELLNLAKSGVSASTLAKQYNVNKATIFRTSHKLGFYYYAIDEQKVIQLACGGMPQTQIAKLLNINTMTVTRILRKNNISFNRARIGTREDFNIEAIREDYINQMTISQICQKYNISKTTFYRTKKTYSFDTRIQIYSDITKQCDINGIIEAYKSGTKTIDICKKFSISQGTLYRIIKSNNLSHRRQQ